MRKIVSGRSAEVVPAMNYRENMLLALHNDIALQHHTYNNVRTSHDGTFGTELVNAYKYEPESLSPLGLCFSGYDNLM